MAHKYSKNYRQIVTTFDQKQIYPISQAVSLVKTTSPTKFDATVELAFNLNIKAQSSKEQIRGVTVLPAGTGKTKKILVLTNTKNQEAIDAGADFVGGGDLITKIQKENWFEFDIIIATPEIMAELSKIAKILGPKGLMPNPKTKTVTVDVAQAISEVRKGQIEYRSDKFGNVHVILGKVSFSEEQLLENYRKMLDVIRKAKPVTVKGAYIKNISLSSTMGPGIKVQIEV